MKIFKTNLIGVILCLFTIVCRFSYQLADWYANNLYPIISASLSWVSSFTSISIQDFALVGIFTLAVWGVITAVRRKWRIKRLLKYEATIVLWTYVWFYIGWCTNYSRSSIYMRTNTEYIDYEEERFVEFVKEFIDNINRTWTKDCEEDFYVTEKEMKDFYAAVPKRFGLSTPREWQHPKTTMFNSVYSSVGILGFMEPLFSESCLNKDLPPLQRPFVHAHEYSHLLGISSEAECNWWAYNACIHSKSRAVQYSGYLSILPYVMSNARVLLDTEKYEMIMENIRPEVLEEINDLHKYWRDKQSPMFRKIHEQVYDIFLKGNNIPSGRKNYSDVVGMIMAIKQ